MAIRRLYFGVENIALTAPQRQTLVDALQQIGTHDDPSPAKRNHWRVRLDGDAVILEGEYDDSVLTVVVFKTRLATIFGVGSGSITSTTTNPAYGTLISFSYQTVARFRVLMFGGSSATYAESQAAARQYLTDNAAAWEGNPD